MDIGHLEFLAGHGELEHLKEPLYSSRYSFWGSLERDEFTLGFQNTKLHLSGARDILRFLKLHLVTEYLLFSKESPAWFGPWIENNIDIKKYLPGVNWRSALSGRWYTVPVILVLGDNTWTRYIVVGCTEELRGLDLCPAWADELMDETARSTVRKAAAAASGICPPAPGLALCCYPLSISTGAIQFEGASLGLPLALGFLKVLKGEDLAEGILATGAVDKEGIVSEVGHLQQKINYAGMKGFKVLLYPSQNKAPEVPDGMEALPVSGLEDACMFSTLFAPGSGRDLALLAGMLEDPHNFVNNCDCVPGLWVEWAHRNGKTSSVLNQIRDSGELFETLLRKFEKHLSRRSLEKAETITKLFKPKELEGLTENAPLATFRWFTLNIALANHQGKVLDAANWAKHAGALLDRVRSYDLNECATYHNHKFVTRHNFYHFEPGLLDELKETLRHLEKRYELSSANGYTGDVTLGCLYGSIAQNYGFCGPQYFEDTEQYSRLSRQAFGDKTHPEYREDCLRQLNYMTYAALDAGKFQKARETLFKYLEIEEWREMWPILPRFSPWRHALLARFIADTGDPERGERYLNWALAERKDVIKQEHPWQLWLFNLGRIAQHLSEGGTAAELYSESLDLCLSEVFGPTVHVMALLPLSGLRKLGALSKIDIKKMENMIRKAAGILNPVHFSMLLDEKDLEKVIETTWDRPEMLFPFAYR